LFTYNSTFFQKKSQMLQKT